VNLNGDNIGADFFVYVVVYVVYSPLLSIVRGRYLEILANGNYL